MTATAKSTCNSPGIKVCQIVSAGKNITVAADQNISIKELIAKQDNTNSGGGGGNLLDSNNANNSGNKKTRQINNQVNLTIDSINQRADQLS